METTSKKAVLYMRTAVKEATGHNTFDLQQKSLEDYCKENSIEAVAVFKDIASDKNANKDGLTDAINYLTEHKEETNILLITSLDRLSREIADAVIFYEMLKRDGIIIIAINDGEYETYFNGIIRIPLTKK